MAETAKEKGTDGRCWEMTERRGHLLQAAVCRYISVDRNDVERRRKRNLSLEDVISGRV